MGNRAASVDLSEAEYGELTPLSTRRDTAQTLALGARIILVCACCGGTWCGRGHGERMAAAICRALHRRPRDQPRRGVPKDWRRTDRGDDCANPGQLATRGHTMGFTQHGPCPGPVALS